MIARLKELEAENARLKKMYAEVQLQNDVIKEAMQKKWRGLYAARTWPSGLCPKASFRSARRVRPLLSARAVIDTSPNYPTRMRYSRLAGITNGSTGFTVS